jgi:anti-sigma-K factor RskA
MIPDDLQDQAALYVLGSLDPEESIRLEAAMRGSAELRALVREMAEGSRRPRALRSFRSTAGRVEGACAARDCT